MYPIAQTCDGMKSPPQVTNQIRFKLRLLHEGLNDWIRVEVPMIFDLTQMLVKEFVFAFSDYQSGGTA